MLDYIYLYDKYLLQKFHTLTNIEFVGYFLYIMADFTMLIYPFFLVFYWLYINYKTKDDQVKVNIKEKLLFVFFVSMVSIISLLIISKFELLPIRQRPETALVNSTGLILQHLPDNSFPSNHASTSMSFSTSLFLVGFKKFAYVFFVFGLFTGFSRVAVGVHWPTDVLFGFLIGFFLAYILFFYKKFIDKYFSYYLIKLAHIFKL